MIAHVDADSFFASVLVRKHPHLRGKPLLAMGMGGGFVIAASYEAKAKGVRTGTPLKEALRLIPDAIQMPSDFQETGLASEQIESILRDHCPRIEQMSIDEWYLDLQTLVGGVPDDLSAFAVTLRQTVLDRTGLSVSIGVANSKLLAKMAGEYRKPGGTTVIDVDIGLDAFLKDRPAPAIPGIGRQRRIHTDAESWLTAWDIAHADRDRLVKICGRPGEEMQRELLGECLFPVDSEDAPPKSVSRARSFKSVCAEPLLWAHTLRHLEYIVLKMRRHGLGCRGISFWLRDRDYNFAGTHCSLPQVMDTEEQLQPYVRRCFEKLRRPGRAYTQIGLALWRLSPAGATQFSLLENAETSVKGADVQKTLDILHERFGRNVITRGSALAVKSGTKIGMDMPVYE